MQFFAAGSSLPDKGPMSLGTLGPVMQSGSSALNSLLQTLNLDPAVNPTDLATAEKIRKLVETMNQAASTEAGQKSYSAYASLGNRFPQMSSSREGFAANGADILVNNQKEIALSRFASNWLKNALSENPTLGRYSDRNLITKFNEKFGDQFENDRKSLKRMFLDNVTKYNPATKKQEPVIDTDTNRPITWASWINKHGTDLDKSEIALIEKKFGEGILQYYPGVKR